MKLSSAPEARQYVVADWVEKLAATVLAMVEMAERGSGRWLLNGREKN